MFSVAPKEAAGGPASYLIGLDDHPGAALLAASVRDDARSYQQRLRDHRPVGSDHLHGW